MAVNQTDVKAKLQQIVADSADQIKQQRAMAQTPSLGLRPAVQEGQMKDWAGGAKRSKAMPPWNMQPWRALKGVLTRFTIGMKYGINNWKKALSVGYGLDTDAMRQAWHEGEPGPGLGAEDNSALGFIRQFVAHSFEHLTNAADLADKPFGTVSEKGDDFMANLNAHCWNALCLLEYAIENEDMVREALSQWPVGSPFHRQDLKQVGTAQHNPEPSPFDELTSADDYHCEHPDHKGGVAYATCRLRGGYDKHGGKVVYFCEAHRPTHV